MTGRECAALQEIQLGHVGVEDFASGLDNEYGVTLSARGTAEDIFDLMLTPRTGGALEPRESYVEAASVDLFSKASERVYLEIVLLYARAGKAAGDWFGTFLPPGAPCNWLQRLSLAPDLIRLLRNDQDAAKSLLCALFLGEAFGGLTAGVAEALAPSGSFPIPFQVDASPVAWAKVLDHYSAFAALQATRLLENTVGGTVPRPELCPEGTEQIMRILETISQKTEEISQGQTAMMERIWEIEKAERQLLDTYERSPDQIKESCKTTLRDAPGLHFDELEKPTQKFLLAAEYGYTQQPEDVDFSDVILGNSKAFEFEFRRAIAPVRKSMEIVANALKLTGDFDRYTLGAFKKILKQGRGSLEAAFEKHLVLEKVLEAADRVNREAEAKHLAEKSKPEATTFRNLFLGTPSILAVLPSTGREGA